MSENSENDKETSELANNSMVPPLEDASVSTSNEETQPKRAWSIEYARERLEKIRETGRRHLTFGEQCEILAFAYGGTPNRYLAEVFSVSPTTVSNITGCLQGPHSHPKAVFDKKTDTTIGFLDRDFNDRRNDNRTARYRDVAQEFEALGETDFFARYMTEETFKKVAAARRREVDERRGRK